MTTKNKIRTLVVDDMALARRRVRRFLKADAEIEVIAECADGREAIESIEALAPDLVFLDVQMPEINGFEVSETIGVEQMPATIFVTAYEEHALRAFEVHAIDYLLKPFEPERLRRAVERAKRQIAREERGELNARLYALLKDVRAEPTKHLKRMAIKSSGRTIFLSTEEIDWIEAAGNYLQLHTGRETHLIRERMNQLEAKLDPERFVRVHRSTIINIERIKEMQPLFNGDQVITLRDGTQLTMSRTHRDRLFALLDAS